MNFQMSHYIQMPPYPAKAPYEMFKIDQANWLRGSFGGVGIATAACWAPLGAANADPVPGTSSAAPESATATTATRDLR